MLKKNLPVLKEMLANEAKVLVSWYSLMLFFNDFLAIFSSDMQHWKQLIIFLPSGYNFNPITATFKLSSKSCMELNMKLQKCLICFNSGKNKNRRVEKLLGKNGDINLLSLSITLGSGKTRMLVSGPSRTRAWSLTLFLLLHPSIQTIEFGQQKQT